MFREHSIKKHNETQGASYSYRSSRPEVFCKKDVLRNLAKFTGRHLPILKLNLKNSAVSLYFNFHPFKN